MNVLPHFVLLQSEAWRNVAGHELKVQTKWIITIIIIMTSLYNELYAYGWFGLAEVKQEAMHEHHRKKRQRDKQGHESGGRRGWGGRKKGFLHLLDQLLNPCRVFLLPQGQWCLAHLGLYPMKTKIKNSTLSHYCIIMYKLILVNIYYRASFKKIVIWQDMNSLYKNHVLAEHNSSSRQSHCVVTS